MVASIVVVSTALLIWQYVRGEPKLQLGVVALVVAMVAVSITIVVRRRFWHLADEVIDEDGVIAVRRGRAQVRISAAEIKEINAVPYSNVWTVQICLRRPVPPFGDVITYLPDNWTKVKTHDIERITDELRRRVGSEDAA